MKIMQINDFYYPLGGAEIYFLDICKSLEELGHEVIVVSSSHQPKTSYRKKEYFLPSSRGIKSSFKIFKIWNMFKKIIKENNPDIIHIHNIYYFLSPFILRKLFFIKPSIRTVHDVRLFCPCLSGKIIKKKNVICHYPIGISCIKNGCYPFNCKGINILNSFYKLFVTFYELQVTKELDAIIVGSKYMQEESIRNKIPVEKISINPLYVREEIKGNKDKVQENLILYIGKLEEYKGIFALIHALKLLPLNLKWKAKIIGEGSLFEDIKIEIKKSKMKTKIVLERESSLEKLKRNYQKAFIVVIPSLIPESFCLVGIEAMSFGIPVVAFDVGGIREWLKHGKNGFLVKRGDIKGLVYYIRLLLENKTLAQKLGEEGQRIVKEKFSRKKHIEKLINIYENVLNARRKKNSHKKYYFYCWR